MDDDFADALERLAAHAEWHEMLWSIEYELDSGMPEWVDLGGEGG